MIVLKANYWEHYISTMASAEEMRMSYNARMSCVNMVFICLTVANLSEGILFGWFLCGFFFFSWPSLL